MGSKENTINPDSALQKPIIEPKKAMWTLIERGISQAMPLLEETPCRKTSLKSNRINYEEKIDNKTSVGIWCMRKKNLGVWC